MKILDEVDQDDWKKITTLLVGRRIVSAEIGQWNQAGMPTDGGWTHSGRLELDDGTVIFVNPNDGCGGCSSGNYDLGHLASVDNVITSVRLADEETADWNGHRYQIFVVADAVEVNVLTVEGDDGNGYYGTGYTLMITEPTERN